jgi:hypothetical protein
MRGLAIMKVWRIIFLCTSMLLFGSAFAQQKSTINATVDKNKILLGEPFSLTIEAIVYPPVSSAKIILDSIPHFEFSGHPIIDSTLQGGSLNIKAVYHLTSFDSGHWSIPSIALSTEAKSDSIPIDVVFTDFDSTQAYHDIKDILEPAVEKKRPWWLYATAGILVTCIVLYLLLRKRKKKAPVVSVKQNIDPFQEATESLRSLAQSDLAAKEFYSRLTDIFRLYVYRRKGILSLQKTSGDLVNQLKKIGLTAAIFDRLFASIVTADMVKFAKYITSAEEDRDAMKSISDSIYEIEEIEKVSVNQTKKKD